MLNSEQLHQLADICRQAADTEIMPRFRKLASEQVEEKQNHHDLVTIADQDISTIKTHNSEAIPIPPNTLFTFLFLNSFICHSPMRYRM